MSEMSAEEEDDAAKILQGLSEAVSRISSRLSSIEERLGRIENSSTQGYRVIENTRTVPEGQGELGGQSKSRRAGGGIETVTRVPVCDICGGRLGENFTICGCGRKVCEEHAIQYGYENVCVKCLIETVPLTKRAYKVLVAITNGINGFLTKKKVARLARVDKKDVKAAMQELTQLGFIAKRGWFLFGRNEATDMGINAVGVFRKVYGDDEDVVLFDVELQSYLGGR